MSHLRTHTANMGDPSPGGRQEAGLVGPGPGLPPPPGLPGHPAPTLAQQQQQPASALAMLQAQAAQLRGRGSPPTSTVSRPQLADPANPASSLAAHPAYLARPGLPAHLASHLPRPLSLPVLP